MSDDTTILAYKGFDKNLRCRDFQYEVGKTYEMDGEPEICERGFHGCTNPFDVLDYYGLFDGCGTPNRFAEVELGGKTVADTDSRKVACTKIRVKAELSIAGFIKAAVAWVLEKTRPEKVYVETPTNDDGKKYAKIGSSGNGAKISSTGEDSVVMAAGACSRAAAALGSWITLAEWEPNKKKGRYVPVAVKTARVDGKKIKAGVFYQLVDGKFTEVG